MSVRELARAALTVWENRFSKYVNLDSPTMMAAFVDPSQCRAIHEMQLTKEEHDEVWNQIYVEAALNHIDGSGNMTEAMLRRNEQKAKLDCESYREELERLNNQVGPKDNPLKFFQTKGEDFWKGMPGAKPVVMSLLSLPGSESFVEQSFSSADGFVTKKRNRIGHENLEHQVVLRGLFKQEWFSASSFWKRFEGKLLEIDANTK